MSLQYDWGKCAGSLGVPMYSFGIPLDLLDPPVTSRGRLCVHPLSEPQAGELRAGSVTDEGKCFCGGRPAEVARVLVMKKRSLSGE